MKLSDAVAAIQPPPITEVKSWLAELRLPPERPLIDLCQAIPDYSPPAPLIDHLEKIIREPDTSRYTADEGLPATREAVSRWYRRRYNAGPTAGEICLTIGASQAFWLAMTSLCQAGDEVIVQLPAYFDHPMGLQALGIRCVWAPFTENTGGLPDPSTIASLITPRTRAILLVTPNNPTGTVIPPDTLQTLFELARQHDICLVLDETYNAFLPPGKAPHKLFARSAWQDHFIHLASFGKTFALTGYRAGALVAGEAVIAQALKVQDTMAVCQPRLTQEAVRFGCDHLDDWVAANAGMMNERQRLFLELFQQGTMPFTLNASGSFFAWVRHPWPELSSRDAARRLLTEYGILCLPGAGFGPGLEGYLRLALGNLPDSQIPAAVAVLRSIKV